LSTVTEFYEHEWITEVVLVTWTLTAQRK